METHSRLSEDQFKKLENQISMLLEKSKETDARLLEALKRMDFYFQETNLKLEQFRVEMRDQSSSRQAEEKVGSKVYNDKGILGTTPCVTIKFPEFNPTNPRYWIRKCELFFAINGVEESLKVKLASFYLDEEADTWFYNWSLQNRNINWAQFVDQLCKRFGDRNAGNVVEEFNHLKQTGSVIDYVRKFEQLKGMMLGENLFLPDRYFTFSFVGGLTDPLKSLVRTHAPATIGEAIDKARLHEAALKALSKSQTTRSTITTNPNTVEAKSVREFTLYDRSNFP